MSPVVNKLPHLLYQLPMSPSLAFSLSPFLTLYLYRCSYMYIKLFFKPFENKLPCQPPFTPYISMYIFKNMNFLLHNHSYNCKLCHFSCDCIYPGVVSPLRWPFPAWLVSLELNSCSDLLSIFHCDLLLRVETLHRTPSFSYKLLALLCSHYALYQITTKN